MLHPSNAPDPRVVELLTRSEKPALIVSALVAAGVYLIWLFPALADIAPGGWSTMSLFTAAGILILVDGIALSGNGRSSVAYRSGIGAGIAVAAFGGAVTIMDVLGIHEVGGFELPSIQTAIAFVFTGLALALTRANSVAIDATLIVAWGFLLFMLGGHVFHSEELVSTADGRLISPQTLLCFVLITFVLSGRRAMNGGPLSILVNAGMGSRITRRILPAAVFAPFVIFWLVGTLNRNQVFPPTFTRAVIAPIVVVAVLALIGWMGVRMNRLERSLRTESVTDELTGLLNRRGYEAVSKYVVAASRRSNSGLIVFFFDLDRLKSINDTLGHDVGDLAIKGFADIIRATFRHSDVIARVGGDEFVALAVGNQRAAQTLLSGLEKEARKMNLKKGQPFELSYSVGFAALHPDSEISLDDALAHADGFMYEQKRLKTARHAAQAASERAAKTQSAPAKAAADWSI